MIQIIDRPLTNRFRRPYTKLDAVIAIVLHWPGNPGQSALDVRNYWEVAPGGNIGSAHFIVDLDGSIVRAIPEDEKAYHVGSIKLDPKSNTIYTDFARQLFGRYAAQPDRLSPNAVTIGIEMCHLDWKGTFTKETLSSATKLCGILCRQLSLDPISRIITHYDVVGWKDCPRWFVNNPADLDSFRFDVALSMED